MMLHSEPVFHAIDRGLLSCASLPRTGKAKSGVAHGVGVRAMACAAVEWRFQPGLMASRTGNGGLLFWSIPGRRVSSAPLGGKIVRGFAPLHGSAMQCLFCLGGLLLASFLLSLLLPGVRAAHDFSSDPVRPGTILIQDEGAKNTSAPTMTIDQVRTWERSRQRYR